MKHLAMCLTLVTLVLGASDLVLANHLPAPPPPVCPVVDGSIMVDWEDVAGATKYSVDVVAGYDTTLVPDGVVDVTLDFDFGTGDRTDGAPISQSDLAIPLSALAVPFDTDGDPLTPDVILDPVTVTLRVKTLHPGRGQGRQNSAFSDFCTVTPR